MRNPGKKLASGGGEGGDERWTQRVEDSSKTRARKALSLTQYLHIFACTIDSLALLTCYSPPPPPPLSHHISLFVPAPYPDTSSSRCRYFKTALSVDALIELMHRQPTPSERASLVFWHNFDSGFGNGIDLSANQLNAVMGGGKLGLSPIYVPSTAPYRSEIPLFH